MKRTIPFLAVLLLVQIILALVLTLTGGQDFGAFAAKEPLLDIDLNSVDRISIEQADKPVLALSKTDDSWGIPVQGGFPVAKSKLDNAINKLLQTMKSWPVATTESAVEHFRVADDAFERKITFSQGDTAVKTLLLGSAPGFKQVHARVAGDNEIYQIPFSVFEVGADADSWTDKNYLKLTGTNITKAELPGLILERQGKQVTVAGLAVDEQAQEDAAKQVLEDLSDLSFTSVLGTDAKPEYHQDTPLARYTLHREAGEPLTYTLTQLGDDENAFVLKVSSHPYFFKLNKMTADKILDVKRDKLVIRKVTAAEVSADNDEHLAVPVIPD